jgi:hypothetical protein
VTRRFAFTALLVLVLCGCAAGGDGPPGEMVEIPGLGATRIDVPRPTGPASAACDDDPLPPSSAESIAERIAAFRAIGLFADRDDVNDAALAAEVDAQLVELWGDTLDTAQPVTDLLVAEQDHARVWWRDLEADVTEGNEVYVTTIEELAAISVGSLDVEDVTETWAAPDGPVTVRFRVNGAKTVLEPAMLEDWIDPGILVALNEVVADSGRRFELYRAFDQTAFVMALTDDERRALEARGWCFE